MWFRVCFVSNRPDILAFVGADGKIYWKTESVARFLGYKRTDRFAQRYGKVDLNNLVPKLAGTFTKQPVFSFEEMIETMSNVRYPYTKVKRLSSLWAEGNVINLVDSGPTLIPNASPRLLFTDNKNTIKIKDWIKSYVEASLKNFSRLECMEKLTYIEQSKNNVEEIIPNLPEIENKNQFKEKKEHQQVPIETSKKSIPHMEEEAMDVTPSTNEISDVESFINPIFKITYNGMIIPEEIYLNINGEVYSYIKAFPHLIDG